MPTKIIKPFALQLDDGALLSFQPGEHDLTALPDNRGGFRAYSQHFQVLAHSDQPSGLIARRDRRRAELAEADRLHLEAAQALVERRREDLAETEVMLAEGQAALLARR